MKNSFVQLMCFAYNQVEGGQDMSLRKSNNSVTKKTVSPPPRASETRSANKPTVAAPPIKK
ncbi:hypothetical protein BK134_12795 [Paenibacillus peoriae]|nr:hypothetical protein BK134_12795 [Paenibacillus peoriae]RPE10585.1 hypothetical protein EG487_02640 [Paenibacillus polymyxa]